MDPNDLLSHAWKWRHGNVSLHSDGDHAAAPGRIKAKHVRAALLGKLFPASRITSSMFCMTEEDRPAIDDNLRDLLATPVKTLGC